MLFELAPGWLTVFLNQLGLEATLVTHEALCARVITATTCLYKGIVEAIRVDKMDAVYVAIGIGVWIFMYVIGSYSVSILGFVRG